MDRKTEQRNAYDAAGFTLARHKKHQIWHCPCGHTQLVESASHAEGRGPTNGKLRIKRTLRICEQNLKNRKEAA